jgi:hypothetical protein
MLTAGLLASGCGGSKKAASPAAGTATPAGEVPAITAPPPAAAAPTAAAGSKASAAATARPGTSAAPAGPGSASPGSTPKLGKYVFSVSGTEQGKGEQPSPVPPGTTLTVEYSDPRPVPGGVDLTSRITEQKPGESDDDIATVNTERWESARTLLMKTSLVAGSNSFDCEYAPPPEVLHRPVKAERFPKQTWSNDKCSGSIEIEVLTKEKVSAAGRSWDTWKTARHTVFSIGGLVTSDQKETVWFSTDLQIEVKLDQTEDVTAGTESNHSEHQMLLTSHP